MTPIRPHAFPAEPASAPSAGAEAARQAAQRAFFDAAMGRAAAAPAPARPSADLAQPSGATAAPQRIGLRFDPAADPPAKPLRPGSLLDIRV